MVYTGFVYFSKKKKKKEGHVYPQETWKYLRIQVISSYMISI
jgi:hypothetical protein